MIQNRLLSHQLEESKKDFEILENQIRNLEDINLDFIFNGLEIDWNLMYSGNAIEDDSDYIFDYDQISNGSTVNLSDTETLDNWLDEQNLTTSFSLPPKSLMHEKIFNIEDTVRKLGGFELEQRFKFINQFGLKGKRIELKKPNLQNDGHLKFYDGKI